MKVNKEFDTLIRCKEGKLRYIAKEISQEAEHNERVQVQCNNSLLNEM